MGTMTLTQLENEIRYNLGSRTDLDSRLVTFLNWAQEEIARQHTFRDMENLDTSQSTVADQDYINHPTSIKDLISIRLLDATRSRKLVYVPERRFDHLVPKPDEYSTGRPSHYFSWGTKFYLWRIPDAAYSVKIRYVKWPTALSGGGDTSDFDNLDEGLVKLATAKALQSIEAPGERIRRWSAFAGKIISQAIVHDLKRFTDEAIQGDYRMYQSGPDYWKDPFVTRMR